MKVDQDFSAAIFNADFEKAARLIVREEYEWSLEQGDRASAC
jgi:hypothetical protein